MPLDSPLTITSAPGGMERTSSRPSASTGAGGGSAAAGGVSGSETRTAGEDSRAGGAAGDVSPRRACAAAGVSFPVSTAGAGGSFAASSTTASLNARAGSSAAPPSRFIGDGGGGVVLAAAHPPEADDERGDRDRDPYHRHEGDGQPTGLVGGAATEDPPGRILGLGLVLQTVVVPLLGGQGKLTVVIIDLAGLGRLGRLRLRPFRPGVAREHLVLAPRRDVARFGHGLGRLVDGGRARTAALDPRLQLAHGNRRVGVGGRRIGIRTGLLLVGARPCSPAIPQAGVEALGDVGQRVGTGPQIEVAAGIVLIGGATLQGRIDRIAARGRPAFPSRGAPARGSPASVPARTSGGPRSSARSVQSTPTASAARRAFPSFPHHGLRRGDDRLLSDGRVAAGGDSRIALRAARPLAAPRFLRPVNRRTGPRPADAGARPGPTSAPAKSSASRPADRVRRRGSSDAAFRSAVRRGPPAHQTRSTFPAIPPAAARRPVSSSQATAARA